MKETKNRGIVKWYKREGNQTDQTESYNSAEYRFDGIDD